MAYLIQINEYQRDLILKTLQAGKDQLGLDHLPGMAGMDVELGLAAGEDTALQELEIIIELLGELPKVEIEAPGIIHGFNL